MRVQGLECYGWLGCRSGGCHFSAKGTLAAMSTMGTARSGTMQLPGLVHAMSRNSHGASQAAIRGIRDMQQSILLQPVGAASDIPSTSHTGQVSAGTKVGQSHNKLAIYDAVTPSFTWAVFD